ncbi:MAG: hypothetical protein HKP61_07705 [Dactylosporangium sp.]|nr:hypothetical protein [Dactylosporangium sp.]NNJ60821.1 hypothetical protein [Dactylosporangium sp.]
MNRHDRRAWILVAAALVAICGATLVIHNRAAVSAPAADRLVPLSAEVHTAYHEFWAAWLAASARSDPDLPALSARAANPYLEVLRANLDASRQQNRVVKGTVGHGIRGMYDFGSWYRVVDCVDVTQWTIYDRATERRIKQALERPNQLGATTFERVDGTWKATHGQILGECP